MEAEKRWNARSDHQNSSGTEIIVCGLNGTGKSTSGKVLADKLQFRFIDNGDLYFL